MSDTVYFKQKYITNTTVTSEDAVVQVAQQLTMALKGNLQKGTEDSRIDQIKNLDAIFNKTAEKFRYQK